MFANAVEVFNPAIAVDPDPAALDHEYASPHNRPYCEVLDGQRWAAIEPTSDHAAAATTLLDVPAELLGEPTNEAPDEEGVTREMAEAWAAMQAGDEADREPEEAELAELCLRRPDLFRD